MKDLVLEPDRWRLVRVPFGQLDVDLPDAAGERGCARRRMLESARCAYDSISRTSLQCSHGDERRALGDGRLTLFGPFERDEKLVHLVVDERHLVVAHQAVQRETETPCALATCPRRPPGAESRGEARATHSFVRSVSMRRFGELILPDVLA